MLQRTIVRKILALALLVAMIFSLGQILPTASTVMAAVTPFSSVSSAGDLIEYLIADPNITVTGTPVYGGVITAASRFDSVNFGTISDVEYALPQGILVTSGNGQPPTSNTSSSFTGSNGMPGDSDVETYAGVISSRDAFSLQFDFTVPDNYKAIEFKFMFGSDEYPEYMNSVIDGAAVIVDDVNYAYLPGNIPLKVVTEANLTNNPAGTLAIEYDGISPPQKIVALLDETRLVHSIKIVIADTLDTSLDSGLFIANMIYSSATTGGITEDSPSEYSVTYDGNGSTGGSAPTDSETYAEGETVTVPGNSGSLTKGGHTFAGWNLAADGSGTAYLADQTFSMGNENMTLYAQWTVNSYTISFDSNGGSAVDSIVQDFGTTITPPAAPTREGYTFAGWNPLLPATMPVGGVTVTAQWTRVRYETSSLEIEKVEGLDEAVDISDEVAAGQDVDVVLKIKLVEETDVPSADKILIEQKIASEAQPENVCVLYLDVSLFKITGSGQQQSTEKITQADGLIRISFLVPEEHRGGENYRVVRVHDGITEYITVSYDPASHLAWFETDKFSTYALTYEEIEEIVIPITGESASSSQLWGAVLLMAALMIIMLRKKLRAAAY